jgi:hypothetical protein
VFLLIGAIVARELYPQSVAHRDLEYGVSNSAAVTTTSPVSETVPYHAGSVSPRDSVERTGGPIPPVPFEPAPQEFVKTRVATEEVRTNVTVSLEKSRRTENKSTRMKHGSRRTNGNQPNLAAIMHNVMGFHTCVEQTRANSDQLIGVM